MRMINLAIQALLQAAGLAKTGQRQEALQILDQALEGLFGLRADLAKRLEDQVLLEALTEQGKLDVGRLQVAADIFEQEGDIYRESNRPEESRACYLRALSFNLEAGFHPEEIDAHQIRAKIDHLLEMVDPEFLPADTGYAVFCYWEDLEAYHQAEQVIHRLYQNPNFREEIRPEYLAFLERLLAKSDQELSAANLSRSQVQKWREAA